MEYKIINSVAFVTTISNSSCDITWTTNYTDSSVIVKY